MDRKDWWATDPRVVDLDTTEHAYTHKGKGKSKKSLLAHAMILYMENPKDPTKNC